jgi:hypothetical protein
MFTKKTNGTVSERREANKNFGFAQCVNEVR